METQISRHNSLAKERRIMFYLIYQQYYRIQVTRYWRTTELYMASCYDGNAPKAAITFLLETE